MSMDWKAVYDSVTGTSHIGTELPCQDACRVVQLKFESGNLLIACSSDGAGSASHSDEGARIACDTFVQIISREFGSCDVPTSIDRETITNWLGEVRTLVELRALELGVEVRQVASTILGAVIGETSALFVQIGDGAIVASSDDGYRTVFWPQSGEFANTTNFLTDGRFAEMVEWRRVEERIDELAIFSDGLERLILRFADRTVHEPFLLPLFKSLRSSKNPEEYFEPLRRFLDSPQVNARTDDDKTLILVTRVSQCDNNDAVH